MVPGVALAEKATLSRACAGEAGASAGSIAVKARSMIERRVGTMVGDPL
jgi:hypothetical protein